MTLCTDEYGSNVVKAYICASLCTVMSWTMQARLDEDDVLV